MKKIILGFVIIAFAACHGNASTNAPVTDSTTGKTDSANKTDVTTNKVDTAANKIDTSGKTTDSLNKH